MTRGGPIVLTSGEPAGIAPEITAGAWFSLRNNSECCFFLLGDAEYWRSRNDNALPVRKIDDPGEAAGIFSTALPVLHRPLAAHPGPGRIASATANQVIAAIDESVGLAFLGKVSAIVTNPIQKEALFAAGFRHQGHTDYLAALSRKAGHSVHEVMMLVAGGLRTIPVTVHIPLADVSRSLTTQAIVDQARVTAHDLRRYFAISSPRLAFTGLNPHAGENGAFGTEERDVIEPALRQLADEGLAVLGPLPADSAFHAEARKRYDAILCMYHDQALIPAKTLDFHGGINVSLGLPFVRTSPDHGTALDIAGRSRADPRSLTAAIELAAKMVQADRG
ncbi:MAG: 4-hydroxythreonine-4-phosphate dehydrogenase PdxA [Rhizobiales bacterium]|nr:4-hydroxythreonine-4-phosphate dehydrogenase PdxA [Hyphomicrobiales bacterium]MBI3673361.1 4-hydroxythreonine-4-phosphate dehydrogenase PdxA [Hyphomicrobiales bacterium]